MDTENTTRGGRDTYELSAVRLPGRDLFLVADSEVYGVDCD
jgi:hypothetical protein